MSKQIKPKKHTLTKKQQEAQVALFKAAEAFLRSVKATPVLIGDVRLQHQPGSFRYNHELLLCWTGQAPKALQDQIDSL